MKTQANISAPVEIQADVISAEEAKDLNVGKVLIIADKEERHYSEGRTKVGRYLLYLAASTATVEAFLMMCEAAQDKRKADLSDKAVKENWTAEQREEALKLPQCYVQAKSNINKVWDDFGLHPKTFQSYSELTKRLNEERNKRKAADKSRGGGEDDAASEAASTVLGAMDTVIKSSKVSDKLADIVVRISKLPEDQQDELIVMLDTVISKYEAELEPEAGDDADALENAQIEHRQANRA